MDEPESRCVDALSKHLERYMYVTLHPILISITTNHGTEGVLGHLSQAGTERRDGLPHPSTEKTKAQPGVASRNNREAHQIRETARAHQQTVVIRANMYLIIPRTHATCHDDLLSQNILIYDRRERWHPWFIV